MSSLVILAAAVFELSCV